MPAPRAPKETWEIIKQLWIQGLKPAIIAERYGVSPHSIQIRAKRHNWLNLRTSTKQMLITQSQPLLSDAVAKASIAARNGLSAHLEACVATLKAPISFRDAATQQALLEPMVRNAEKLFQWSQSGQSSMVSIQSLSADAPPGQVGQLDSPAQPTIDVAPVTPALAESVKPSDE